MKFNCDSQNAESWHIRAESAVDMLLMLDTSFISQNKLKIADFGCGNERIKNILTRKLGNKFDYYGYDLYPQQESTYKMDISKNMPQLKFDVIFCLGLLEYLQNLNNVFLNLSRVSKFFVISYVISDSKIYSQADVSQKQWLHHYSIKELESKLLNSNLVKKCYQTIGNGKTGLWLFESNFTHDK